MAMYRQPINPNKYVGGIETLFDTQEIDGTTQTVRFFPSVYTQDARSNNYRGNPLHGTMPYEVVALGFQFVLPTLQIDNANNVVPQHWVNLLKQAAVRLTLDAGAKTLFRVPFDQLSDLDCARYEVATSDTTDGGVSDQAAEGRETLVLPAIGGAIQLWQPFRIEANSPFDLELVLPQAATTLLANDDIATSAQGADAFKIRAVMQTGVL